MGSNFDTVLYTSYDSPDMTPGDCSGKNRVGCDDNSAGEGQARISLWDIGCDTGSAYWLVLDGAGEMDQGAYRLNWTLTPR
jgi:hypothetical protein